MTTSISHIENRTSDRKSVDFDAIVVGAGFAGMYMLVKLRELGFSATVIEAGTEVGGTWYWNRYPGARCDVASLDYQYSFSEELQKEWNWTERYATQPEILRYACYVADKFDLRRDIQFETRVTSARWSERDSQWVVGTDRGDELTSLFLIAGTGCLSVASTPSFEGLETFEGETYHTGKWPHEGVGFTGKRVAVIGTGSSGIQSIPVIAKQADHVYVFQRTPNFSLPAANHLLTQEQIDHYRDNFAQIKAEARKSRSGIVIETPDKSVFDVPAEEREREFSERWVQGGFQMLQAYKDLVLTNEANQIVAEFVRSKIREAVKDPAVAEDLQPQDHPLGTKRICIDMDYFDTYNRDNVSLINIRKEPIEGMTPAGVKTAAAEYEVDAIVFATGFDAMTGALFGMNIEGKDGIRLNGKWAAGPRTYLGLASAGFPNFFSITGPGSPSVFSNMIISIEQHVDWISDCLDFMRTNGVEAIEATVDAEDAWVDHVNELASMTLYPQANSWYLGANIPGKPRVFMPYAGGVGTYRERCDQVAASGYEGFVLTASAVPA